VARELTKLHEEVRRGTLPELADHYEETGPPKGEVVVVIAPPDQGGRTTLDAEGLDARLRAALARVSLREAVLQVVKETGLPRKRVYTRALELAGKNGDDS
jgi:16S rRNA (cytidine1402-2'-O)-methyltransferase